MVRYIPSGLYPQPGDHISPYGRGLGTVTKGVGKIVGNQLSRGLSGFTRSSLKNRSRAAGYGTGAGIGIASLFPWETSITDSSGADSQRNFGFNTVRRFRRYYKYSHSCNCSRQLRRRC